MLPLFACLCRILCLGLYHPHQFHLCHYNIIFPVARSNLAHLELESVITIIIITVNIDNNKIVFNI